MPMPMPMNTHDLTVLLVEDDPHMQLGCMQALQLAGLRAQSVESAEAALPRIAAGFPGVLVTDMRLPGNDGLSLIHHCRKLDADLPVIMITGHGDMGLAVEAMRSGAYDFMPKPFSSDSFVEVVSRALEKRALTLEVASLRTTLFERRATASRLVGRSPQIEQVRRLIREVAVSPIDVLIRGETGTGKELVAQALHEMSPRKSAPFVAINCGGMPDNLLDSELFGHEQGAFTGAHKRRVGKIEYANGGTLFLDELESMPMGMQIKLLRVLQDRRIERLGSNRQMEVEVRVVAATKEDLLERSRANTFRSDLYYRLNVVAIDLPPLRERRDDIPVLLEHFTWLAAGRYGRPQPTASTEQMKRLVAHNWPGNVRELRNVADCLVLGIRSDVLDDAHPFVDGGGNGDLSLQEVVESFERGLIAEELRRQAGNVASSARTLRIAKTTLADKIRKYGLL
jgi:DNA-binding NtrC family response regulator